MTCPSEPDVRGGLSPCTGPRSGARAVLKPTSKTIDHAWPGIGDVQRGVERGDGGRASFGSTRMS